MIRRVDTIDHHEIDKQDSLTARISRQISGGRARHRNAIMDLAGQEIKSSRGFGDSLEGDSHEERIIREKGHVHKENDRDKKEVIEDAKETLEDIGELAQTLTSLNMEHRVGDAWDSLPIFANIRSHKLANKEARAIDRLHSLVRKLETIVYQNNLPLDLDQLVSCVSRIKAPGGVSKWIGTIFTSFRELHRGFTPQRAENLREALQNLRRQARQASRAVR